MKGRPESAEATEYFAPYIAQARGEDVVELLEAQSEEWCRIFAGISEEKSR